MKYIPFFIDDKFNGGYRIYNHKNIGIGSSDLGLEVINNTANDIAVVNDIMGGNSKETPIHNTEGIRVKDRFENLVVPFGLILINEKCNKTPVNTTEGEHPVIDNVIFDKLFTSLVLNKKRNPNKHKTTKKIKLLKNKSL